MADHSEQQHQQPDPSDRAPDAPHDPSHAAAPQPTQQAPDPAPPAQQPPAEPSPAAHRDSREEMAERFMARRREAVAPQEPEPQPEAPPAAPAADGAPQGQEPQPAAPGAPSEPAAPQNFTLKVRGKDVQVSRADAIRYASEIEPHNADKLSDAELQRLAQYGAAGLAFIDEGRSFRDQARVAAPAPAAPQAGDPQQHQPLPQQQAPSLAELRAKAIERMQMGDPADAEKAWQAYDDARDADYRARADAQSAEANSFAAARRDVAEFGERNKDIVDNPMLGDMLLMTATREMESDLRAIGLTDEHLRTALNNPTEMTRIYGMARQQGLRVRENKDLLEAAGAKIRHFAKLPAPGAAPAQDPSPPAVQTRLDEKRGLQAQPLRSGTPQPVTPVKPDPNTSRKEAIANMNRSRGKPAPVIAAA